MLKKDIIIIEKKEKIKINKNLIDTMYNYIQINKRMKEAGGVLIGKENASDENKVINYITTPMFGDKRTKNMFIRKDEGHVKFFKNLYILNRETLRYFGEWHTHYEAVPNYSNKDLKNWKKISKNSKNTKDFYHIILGYEAFRIWKYNFEQSKVELIKTVYWKDIYE